MYVRNSATRALLFVSCCVFNDKFTRVHIFFVFLSLSAIMVTACVGCYRLLQVAT